MKHFLLGLFLLAVSVLPADAAFRAENEVGTAELLIETHTPKADTPFWAAVEITVKPDWHIYWQNAGDSGIAPSVEWTLPKGFSTGPIHWQPPEAIQYGDLVNYGYSGTTALLVPIIPSNSTGEEALPIKVKFDYLVCKDVCIPESAELSLTLDPAVSDQKDRILPYLENLPAPFLGNATYREQGSDIVLQLKLTDGDAIGALEFFPIDDGIISNSAERRWEYKDGNLVIRAERGTSANLPENYRGLLVLKHKEKDAKQFYSLTSSLEMASAVTPAVEKTNQVAVPSESEDAAMTFAAALLFAFIGGIILNAMPCVLPILSLKTLSIAKKHQHAAHEVRLQGVAYTVGVVLSFVAIAGIMLALKEAGEGIGWGFQLQSPAFVTVLIYVLFLIGLNLSGLFELPSFGANVGQNATQGEGLSASFFTGALATLVATPCTAPFMASALGYAITLPPLQALLIFVFLGLGLASPYVLICFIPALRRIIPKPGNWMKVFKEFLAFPIYASVAWLVWVLAQQSGAMGLAFALMGLCVISFGLWALRYWSSKLAKLILFVLCVLPIIWSIASQAPETHSVPVTRKSEPFSIEAIEKYRKEGTPVFVDATAAWCITCKINERVALSDSEVIASFEKHKVKMLIADWTNRDQAITDYLASFGRNGVPLYVYYAPQQEPVLLPQILTPSTVIEAIESSFSQPQ